MSSHDTTGGADGAAGSTTDGGATQPSVEELEAKVEQTRHDLGETVDALSAKLDVKSRARDQVSSVTARAKDAATDERGNLSPSVPIAAGVAVLVLVGVVVLVRRRRR